MSQAPERRSPIDPDRLREAIRDRYAQAAREAAGGPASCGCGCKPDIESLVSTGLYSADEARNVPTTALLASLGCGNPTALAELRPGEVVLDLGSGGGVDVLLSARRVGPGGKAYGLDMTEEMLELALRNQAEAGVDNVEFLLGRLEEIPLPDASVDVVISNCVINLTADKSRVLAEAHRVLRPGGRFAVADIVALRPVPDAVAAAIELWSACISGALEVDDYRRRLRTAGFTGVDVEIISTYGPGEVSGQAKEVIDRLGIDRDSVRDLYASALVRARKPEAGRG